MATLRRSIRHVAGILFATFATILFLGILELVVQHDPEATTGLLILTGLIGLAFAAIAFWLLRKTVPVRSRPCPSCGGYECQPAGVLARRRSLLLRHVGGFLLESLWGQSQRQQVSCIACGTLYFTETKSSRAWGVAGWVFILLLLISALAEHYLPNQ
jgi:hypothetical protein